MPNLPGIITSVVLNPAIDKIYFLDDFQVGKMFRSSCIKSSGGKGVNVARVAKLLGAKVNLLGFVAGHTGKWLESDVQNIGIQTMFTPVKGETRTNNNIIDKKNNTETELLEPGPDITGEDINNFMLTFEEALSFTKLLVISGGLPQGIPHDFYFQLIKKANEGHIKVILDTSGNTLVEGIKATPYMIKPNLRELSYLLEEDLCEEDIIPGCKTLISKGIKIVLASLGKDGALLVSDDLCLKAQLPEINVINSIGSGDSLVAGFSVGIANGLSIEEAFRLGVACGINNAQHMEIGLIQKDQVNILLKDIKINSLSPL